MRLHFCFTWLFFFPPPGPSAFTRGVLATAHASHLSRTSQAPFGSSKCNSEAGRAKKKSSSFAKQKRKPTTSSVKECNTKRMTRKRQRVNLLTILFFFVFEKKTEKSKMR